MSSTDMSGTEWSAQTRRDGAALALLLVALFAAETFDTARAEIQALAGSDPPAARLATPSWLWVVWSGLVVAGAFVGGYVARRFVAIARELDESSDRGLVRTVRRFMPAFAVAAVVVWLGWQVAGILVVADVYAAPNLLIWSLRALAALLAGAAVCLGGAVLGDATVAIERGPLVRLQLVFLLVLFILVFRASFVSDQLTDVLRGWGDGPMSRPLAGIAAALLLGAVLRASASRLLLPRTSADPSGLYKPAQALAATMRDSRDRHVRRLAAWHLLAGLGILLFAVGLRTLGLAFLGAAGLARFSTPTVPPPEPSPPECRGLRRLAGTIGVAPLGILVVGLTEASLNSLLLPSGPSGTDRVLFITTAIVAAAFGVLAAHAHVVVRAGFDVGDNVPGEAFGAAGFVAAVLSVISPLLAAVILLALATALASRRFGERGAIELWAAWGAGLGLAVAVYIDPVEVSRGIGGFGVVLVGATAILALLHPAASLGARRRLAVWPRWRVPVISALAVWIGVAWCTAPADRNHVGTVAAASRPEPLSAAVAEWLERQTADPVGTEDDPYVPMLLVAASGGGSKAAYWTDLVLDCAFGRPVATPAADECPGAPQAERRYGRLFLTSSVSGGSVGIYQLIRHARVVGREPEWIERTNGREVLSPLLAWGLFHDLPAYLIGAPTDPARCADALSCPVDADRAAVQAAAIAGREGRADATSPAGSLLAQDGPVTVMNTAQVPRQDPGGLWPTRRVVLSRVSLGEPRSRSGCPGAASQPIPDTFDGHDLVGSGQDLTVATSAMLSARFPFLEPPGRIGSASHPPREACAGPPADRAAKIRDGGTFENSGLLTLTDVLPSIQEAIERWKRDNDGTADVRLVVVSIDDDVPGIKANDEHDTEGFEPHKPGERTDAARGKLGTCRFEGVTYMRISPVPHVGAQAATGWEVSQTSRREDLVESLLPTSTTGQQVERLRAMLDGTTPPPGCRR